MDQSHTPDSNQSTAKDGFGVHLRREREMRGVTLEEISLATRIGTRFLDALEAEHWDRLPGGVFNRGFVRTTAQFLGLDPEAMLAEYTLATTDATRPAPPVYIHSQSSWTPRTASSPSDRRWLIWVALIAIVAVAAGGYFGWRHYRALRRNRAADAALAVAPAPPAVVMNSAAAPTELDAGSAATETSSSASVPAPQPAANSAATTPPATVADPAATHDAPAATAAAASLAPASVGGALVLKVEAGRATSVRVSADGHRIFQGKIAAGASKTFQANDVFFVMARDAGGVLLELNGQTLPPLGPQGHAGSIRLTRDSLKSQDGASH
jgi:cytoskeleton protein RodZ